ncbi:MAG: type I restriction endonuclease subunit R [bacterium]
MTLPIGQPEIKTQQRIVQLFQTKLGYTYLGDWKEREGTSNVEEKLLHTFLTKTAKYSDILINKAIDKFKKTVNRPQLSLYDLNKEAYSDLRYGIKVKAELGDNDTTIHLIDWKHPENNDFAIAEEVTYKGNKTKRPDIVLYVNGIALGIIELKRSTVSLSEGIRQNIGNQKEEYIKTFFATVQHVLAGNDTEGLRYGTTETSEEYYLAWKEPGLEQELRLDRSITQLCDKHKLLEIIHDFTVFDNGIKKTCRHNQYFAVKAAQHSVNNHEGGIIWHTQGSGKSLTMVWLARWIREHSTDARVLLLTDRTELDEQIETVFTGVDEKIFRSKSSRELLTQLNCKDNWLLCSLVHKFGRAGRDLDETSVEHYLAEIRSNLPRDFSAKGDLFVFVDECHRSHTGKLHKAMKELLPTATFIGFTGTPILKIDKQNSISTFGNYIHTYKYNEAVADKVVLDLRYEARRVDQKIASQEKIDEWFEERTQGLTDVAKSELKRRWGTMQTLLSSNSRLEKIVFDILDDFYKKDRLSSGRGNAMLVASSIYEACQYYDIFQKRNFTKCAVITSYEPNALSTESREYAIYQRMLEEYRRNHGEISPNTGETITEAFERQVKKTFIKEPGRMQLLIVVDKLLTGFDAPSATYLFIDRNMQDHSLFQAICRVNRIDGEEKEYGYIVDYRDLFKKLEKAVTDYTSGGLEGFAHEDVLGLLKDRLDEGRNDVEEALEIVRALCEPVAPPRDTTAFMHYFCGDVENPYSLKENEIKRIKLYKSVGHLLRAYADIANELTKVGYTHEQAQRLQKEVKYFENVSMEIKLASGDYIDLKKYEPAMRTLIDRYITADESRRISALENMTLVELILQKEEQFVQDLPESIQNDQKAVAETVENNLRRVLVEKTPTNPKYYEHMSELLRDLIERRKKEDIAYEEYLRQVIALTKEIQNPETAAVNPDINTPGKKALYDNFGENVERALLLHEAVIQYRSDGFRGDPIKEKMLKVGIKREVQGISDEDAATILEIVKKQDEY